MRQTLQFVRLLGPAAADAKLVTLAGHVCVAASDEAAFLEVTHLILGRCREVSGDLRASLIAGEH